MKIAILSNLFPPHARGGAEQAAKSQAVKLSSEGHSVCVVTLSSNNEYKTREWKNKKIYHLKHKNIFNYFDIGKKSVWLRFLWHIIDIFNFWLANDIKKIVEKESPDLVIAHNLKGLSFLTPLKITKLKIKNYAVIHDVSLYTPSGLIEYGKEDSWEHQGFLTKIYRFFTRRLFSYPEKVFFPSAWLLNFYRKNRFFVNQEKIYKPNEIDFNSHCEERSDAAIPSNNFLYVGQLERHKGILLLLDAFNSFCHPALNAESQDPYVESPTLYIVGDGSLMPEIKKRAEEMSKGSPCSLGSRIVIHGRVPQERLPEFYSRAKAVIVPSIVYENAPNVVYEALACGAPVIVSRIGGAPEPIREGENGHTFEPGNVEELHQKMLKYLQE